MCKLLFIPLLAALALAFTARQALAANETAATQRPDGAAPLPDRITTLDGKSYEKVVLDRVEPDGLLVLFAPSGGGLGAAKLKFRNLPTELRERYGYDAARAADYEGAQARGEAVWYAENTAWAEQRRAAQAEQAALERQMRAEAEARRAEAEQARAEAVENQPVSYYPWWSPGFYGFGFHGGGFHGGGKRFQGNFPHHQPGLGIRESHISPHMGPMRPSGK
jgi:hypothetical protein